MNEALIIQKYEAREAEQQAALKASELSARVAHMKAKMDYDDEHDTQIRTPWRLRPFFHMIGLHFGSRVWDPRWVNGTYGFCRTCGIDIGSGVDESGGY